MHARDLVYLTAFEALAIALFSAWCVAEAITEGRTGMGLLFFGAWIVAVLVLRAMRRHLDADPWHDVQVRR